MRTLYWLRNDLRLHDNLALVKASSNEVSNLSFVYCLNKSVLAARAHRSHFFAATLSSFAEDLSQLGQKIHLTSECITEVLALNPGIESVVFTEAYNSRCRAEEDRLIKFAEAREIALIGVDQTPLYPKSQIPFAIDKLKSFTPFRKKLEDTAEPLEPFPAPSVIPKELTPLKLGKSVAMSQASSSHPSFKAGEEPALDRLAHYFWRTQSVSHYKETRNGMINFDDSSKLSPYLALGSLSPRRVYSELKRYEDEVEKNESTYWLYFELLWRDFFKYYALKHGESLFSLEGPKSRRLDWEPTASLKSQWKKWTSGNTGQDFVDANMRELLRYGWMSNRGRQNVASYWAKHIYCDWRLGAKWFERNLIDFDIESNWGNWAYNSGVGPDPRDRKFDLEKQAEMYDPDRSFRKLHLE